MQWASYIDWSQYFPIDGWRLHQQEDEYLAPVTLKPKHGYRVCTHAKPGQGNLWLNVAISS